MTFGTAATSIGWPGLLLALGFYFIDRYATIEQKREIIQKYVLGSRTGEIWPLMVSAGVFVAIVLAQRHVYSRQLRVKDEEISRLAAWKTEHQESAIQGPLHTTER
jgi:hypothetical protein